VMEILLMFRVAVPVLLSVTGWDPLVVPTRCPPKSKLPGVRLTRGWVPFPDRATVCGLFGASSVMVIAPVRFPAALGLKVTLRVQLAPAATLAPQVPVQAKSLRSAPVMEILARCRVAVPVLLSVTGWDALLVPTRCSPKSKLSGVRLTRGWVPFPDSATVCGLPGASSVMVRLPLRAPVVVGEKVTLMVQLAATARGLPQVLV